MYHSTEITLDPPLDRSGFELKHHISMTGGREVKTEGKLSAPPATVDFMNFLPHPLNDKDNYSGKQKIGEEWVLLTLSVFMLQVSFPRSVGETAAMLD